MTVYSIDSVSPSLKALTGATSGDTAAVGGYWAVGDDGGGDFYFLGVPSTSQITAAAAVSFTISSPTVSSGALTLSCPDQSGTISGWTGGAIIGVYLSDAGTATGAWLAQVATDKVHITVLNNVFTTAPTLGGSARGSFVLVTVTGHGLPNGGQRIAVSGVATSGGAVAINGVWNPPTWAARLDANTVTLPAVTSGGTYTPGSHAVIGDDALKVTATDAGGTVGGIWERVVTAPSNVKWWGAKGDKATDDSPAINAAINSVKRFLDYDPSNRRVNGTTLYLPPGVYYCNTKILIDGSVSLAGAAPGTLGASILRFPIDYGNGDSLVDIRQTATDGSGTNGNALKLSNLVVVQDPASYPGSVLTRTIGVHVRGSGVVLEDIAVRNIQGNGIFIDGESVGDNADTWCLKGHIIVASCLGTGILVEGTLANAGAQTGLVDVQACLEWGVHEHSFLGNSWDAMHTAGNGYQVDPTAGVWMQGGVPVSTSLNVWSSGKVVSATGWLMLPTFSTDPVNHPELEHRTGFIYRATDIGSTPHETGSTEPAWPTTPGATTTDGQITWTCWAYEGGAVFHEGLANFSTYDYIYTESQQPARFDDGTAYVKTARADLPGNEISIASTLISGAGTGHLLPFGVWARRAQPWDPDSWRGITYYPLQLTIGDQTDSTIVSSKRADGYDNRQLAAGAPDIAGHWTHDVGVLRERWDGLVRSTTASGAPYPSPSNRWRVEWFSDVQAIYPFHSYTQVGGRALPQPAAMCFPSIWLGNVTGLERRLGAVPALATAPYLPDFGSLDVAGGNAFEQGDVLFNAPMAGRLNWPAAWRATARNAKATNITYPTWEPATYYYAGFAFYDPTSQTMWRARNSGFTGTPTQPNWSASIAVGFVTDGDVTWDYWGNDASSTSPPAWEALITESQTLFDVDVSAGGQISLTSEQAAHARLQFTGTLTQNAVVIVDPGPGASWTKTFTNATSGAYTVRVHTTATGAGILVKPGTSASLVSTGTDVASLSSPKRAGGAASAVDTVYGSETTTSVVPVQRTLFFLSDSDTAIVNATITARNSSGSIYGVWTSSVAVNRQGNTTTLQPIIGNAGSPTITLERKTDTGLDAKVTAGVVFNQIVIECTGLASTTLYWAWEAQIERPQIPAAVYDPVPMTLTAFYRAGDFTNDGGTGGSGGPVGYWAGTASAGTSGSSSHVASQLTPAQVPAYGVSYNDAAAVDFNGTNQYFSLSPQLSDLISLSAYGGWALVTARSGSPGNVAHSASKSIVATASTGRFGVFIGDHGSGDTRVSVYHNDGTNDIVATAPIPFNQAVLVHWYYNGTVMRIGVNGLWGPTVTAGNISSGSATVAMQVGRAADNATYFDGEIVELTLLQTAPSESTLATDVKAYCDDRYGLFLASATGPTALGLSGWWRASYSSSPWGGTASTGGSAVQDLSEATNPPSTGTALNALIPAKFDGVNDVLGGAALSSFFTTTTGSILMLVNVSAVAGVTPAEGELLSDTLGTVTIGTLNSGGPKVFFDYYDVGWKHLQVALTLSTWTLVQAKWDGSNMKLRTNSNSWSSTAAGTNSSLAGTLRVGASRPTFGLFFDGQVAEVIVASSTLSDATFDTLKAYINARYALSL